ncbi:MAG: hypothetical protein AAF226_02750 [Verrucomicrobiota bacterium]
MSALREFQPNFVDDMSDDNVEIQFDPGDFKAVTPYEDELKDEFQEAQDQLRMLREKEELLRRQAEELEELSAKEEDFKEGRGRVLDRIDRYMNMLDREALDARATADECAELNERLAAHLNSINNLRPETWSRTDRSSELSRALGYINNAEDELANAVPFVDSLSGRKSLFKQNPISDKIPQAMRGDFLYWLKSGIAFSIPMAVIALIGLIIAMIF